MITTFEYNGATVVVHFTGERNEENFICMIDKVLVDGAPYTLRDMEKAEEAIPEAVLEFEYLIYKEVAKAGLLQMYEVIDEANLN